MIFKKGSFAWVCLSFLSFSLIVPYSFFPFVHHSIWFSFGFVHATLPRKRSFCSLLASSSLSPSSSAVFESWGPSSCTHTTVQIEIDRERASRETTGTLRGWSDSHIHTDIHIERETDGQTLSPRPVRVQISFPNGATQINRATKIHQWHPGLCPKWTKMTSTPRTTGLVIN